MKIVMSIFMVLLLVGCEHKESSVQPLLNKIIKKEQSKQINVVSNIKEIEDYGETRRFKNVYHVESLITILKRYNYRYKIVCVDTRNWTRNKRDILKKRKIIAKFGRDLGRKAIIANLIYKTSKKRAYVRKIEKRLGTYFDLDNQAPFLIFYKREGRSYQPYKLVPIASMSKPKLEYSLSKLTKAITMGKSSLKVARSLEKITAEMYASN